MNRRIGFSVLFGLLLTWAFLAGPVSAEALTPKKARATFMAALVEEYGTEFTKAQRKWADCPTVYPSDYGYGQLAGCMAEFRKGRIWTFVNGSVDAYLGTEIDGDTWWVRKWSRCRPGYLRSISLRGVLWTNDRRCSTATLMASDLAGYVRLGLPKRMKRVGWHGTNMIGFGPIATYRCNTKRRGDLYRVHCRNSLGDAFKLRMRVKRTTY